MSAWTLDFVGTGGFHSAHWKGFPCTLLNSGSSKVIFDCGEGSLASLRSLGISGGIDAALLSGATAEELLGLVSVADWLGSARRSTPLSIVGPEGTVRVMDSLQTLKRGRKFRSRVHDASAHEVVFETPTLTITTFGLVRDAHDHGLGFIVQESDLPGRVDMEAAERFGLTGRDIGRLVRGEAVDGVDPAEVVGPARPGRRVVIAGRTRPSDYLLDALRSADVALLAAAYIDERWDVANATGTMTAWEAALAASNAGVSLVALYNVSSSNRDRVVLLEAGTYHPRVIVPGDGDRLEIPQRDSGNAPTLIRRQQRRVVRGNAAQSS